MTDKRFGECLKKLYFDRDPKSNKGDFGRALLIGGSSSYPGAIVIASKLAEVSGDGYTGIRVPDDIFPIVASKVTPLDVFEHFYIEDITPVLKYDSLLFGNGMEVSSLNYELLKKIVSVYQGKMIIDGSGLSILAKYGDGFLQNTGSRILLTPHLKEASLLFKMDSVSKEPSDYLEKAKEYAKTHDVYILLKSYQSILITPDGEDEISSDTGAVALAKAGSGDGLAGFLAGLLAYGPKLVGTKDTILFGDFFFHRAASLLITGFETVLNLPALIKELLINDDK